MTVNGKHFYKKAICITAAHLRSIEQILLRHCSTIKFEGETSKGNTISFEDLEDVLRYDNYYTRRLASLDLDGYNGYHHVVSVSIQSDNGLFANYGHTISCRYEIDNFEIETLMLKALDEQFEKMKTSYWLIGKIATYGVVTSACIIVSLMTLIFNPEILAFTQLPTLLVLTTATMTITILCLLYLFDKHCLLKLFPPIFFCWGDNENRYKHLCTLHKNMLWGVFVSLLVGIVGSIIMRLIP